VSAQFASGEKVLMSMKLAVQGGNGPLAVYVDGLEDGVEAPLCTADEGS
jgi:hypothetical protein